MRPSTCRSLSRFRSWKKSTRLRFDLLNVIDHQYQLRTGAGDRGGTPQYGMRRAFFVTLSQKCGGGLQYFGGNTPKWVGQIPQSPFV